MRNVDDLAQRFGVAATRPAGDPSAMVEYYRIGRWRFDPDEPILRDGSDERRLEDRAARTLELLCRRRGEVVGKEELIAAVWQGRLVSSNSVAVVVGNLRRALEDDPAHPRHIVTINKRGYRLANTEAHIERGPTAPGRVPPLGLLKALAVSAGIVVLVGVAVLSWWPSHHRVEITLEPVRNETGLPSLDPLASSLGAVMIGAAIRVDGTRLVARARVRAKNTRRLDVVSRLIIWNGAPELAMSATDLDTGSVIWSGFAAGPTGALARNTTARLATLGPALKR